MQIFCSEFHEIIINQSIIAIKTFFGHILNLVINMQNKIIQYEEDYFPKNFYVKEINSFVHFSISFFTSLDNSLG